MKIKIFLVATLAVLTSTKSWAPGNACTIQYNCGTGATGTPPSNQTITSTANTFTPASIGKCNKTGYVFNGWLVRELSNSFLSLDSTNNVAYPKSTYTIPYTDTTRTCRTSGVTRMTLTAQWVEIDYTSPKTPTSQSYVDSRVSALQPQFNGLGADKLMTYGTTDGAVGSRDIVTELGTSTTANSVPTMGAILTGLNTKQPMMFGRSGYVVENVGTSGVLQDKPIYSVTNNYENALVDASTLNSAVIDAVNSELIRVDETGEPNANGTLWKLNDVEHLTFLNTNGGSMAGLNVNTNGTSTCYRRLSDHYSDNGYCNAATLSTLGATGSKSGLWGAVMPYGDIVGKSVCSTTGELYATAVTDAQESALTSEFNAQSGVGESALSSHQYACWCKMESINGEPAVSRWVYSKTFVTSSLCAADCVTSCASAVSNGTDFRTALFGAVAQ